MAEGFQIARKSALRVHDCSRAGCPNKADRIPVLVVQAHPMSINKGYAVRSVLWLPVCAKHHGALTIREFLSGEAIAGIQASVTADFHAHNSQPDFGNAVVNFIFKNDPEFVAWDLQQQQAVPN
jgi:hypothetical protein